MGKKILDSKILYVVLSVLISLSLWLWATSRDENKERQTYRVPVTFEGVDILEDRSLMIVNQSITANVQVRATPMVLAALNETPPQVIVNVSSVSSEGTHPVVYTLRWPNGVSANDVELIAGSSGTAVNVEVARALRRDNIEVRGEFQGTVAEGYLAGDRDEFLFSPATVSVSGRAEWVNQVAYVKVIVPGENLTESVDGEYPFEFIGASGDPLDMDTMDISCDVDMIYTRFPIKATAEIPLEVKLIDGGGLKGDTDVRLTLDTESIMVAGSREAVDGLVSQGTITLATIDLATLDDDTVKNGVEMTIPIPLDDQLENVSGVAEVKATLKVTKRNVDTREFETSRISVINAPEGWEPAIITQVVKVKVRGTASLLDELTGENIRVVADLRDAKESAGPYTASASIYLDSASTVTDMGVVNPNSYTIVVSLARAQED